MYTHTHIYIYIYTHTHIYIYIYTHTHIYVCFTCFIKNKLKVVHYLFESLFTTELYMMIIIIIITNGGKECKKSHRSTELTQTVPSQGFGISKHLEGSCRFLPKKT